MTQLRYIDGSLTGDKYKPNMLFRFHIAIPCAEVDSFALLIEHDRQNDANVSSLLRLADEGAAPYCVSVGIEPGQLIFPDGTGRDMRLNSYDLFDREYGDFLVYELIPYIEKEYGINVDGSADMHMLSGGSSGGISAFVVAWFHPEYFHRVYMSSPSFLAMGRGNEIPYLIRKYETKPLRIYEEMSENEPNDYFGWSLAIDKEAQAALEFANYDFKCRYFPGEGHCSRYRDEEQAYERNKWLWQNWRSEKICAKANSPRVERVIPFSSRWEKCKALPEVKSAVPKALSDKYEKAVLSNDGKLWYAASTDGDVVYSIVNDESIDTKRALVHAFLHTLPRFGKGGAVDMAVDKTDRLFVLTHIGVQCVRSFGLVDVILELPDESMPQRLVISDALYIQTDEGIYKRELCKDCVTDGEEKRKQIRYYD